MPRPIDTYLTELRAALRGPRQAKDDLLTEARDSLVDATEAYERSGRSTADAERLAIEDFGAVPEIAPGYQAELGLAQGRRTALLVLAVFGAQPFVWGYAFRWATATTPADTRTGFRIADTLVETLGVLTMIASVVALLGYWIGMRHPVVRARIARATGVFAFGVAALFAGLATFLTVFGDKASTAVLVLNLVWTVAFVLIPSGLIGVFARRCLAMSCPAPR